MYMRTHSIDFAVHQVQTCPRGSWYPVALGWHDFACDYFALLSDHVKNRLRDHHVRVLFYYHEGDNPYLIKKRFDLLCYLNDLPQDCYVFVSANSQADNIHGFRYFPDHEYFFAYVNRYQPSLRPSTCARQFDFTALNRTHKWWRASCMADLLFSSWLDNSLWSYNTECAINDPPEDNPIKLDAVWQQKVLEFLAHGPYVCDDQSPDHHNDHWRVNLDLYSQSYFHLVIETLFDVDSSGGVFLTEKTYKCLKFGQPFIMIGPVGSLDLLRKQGYRVFDHVIDNQYDTISDSNKRWIAIKHTIGLLRNQDLHELYLKCYQDVLHNQNLFATHAHQSLQKLATYLDSVG